MEHFSALLLSSAPDATPATHRDDPDDTDEPRRPDRPDPTRAQLKCAGVWNEALSSHRRFVPSLASQPGSRV